MTKTDLETRTRYAWCTHASRLITGSARPSAPLECFLAYRRHGIEPDGLVLQLLRIYAETPIFRDRILAIVEQLAIQDRLQRRQEKPSC